MQRLRFLSDPGGGDSTTQIVEIGVSPVMIIICTIWAPRGWLAAYVGFFVPVRFQIYKLNSNRRIERSFSSSTEQPARCMATMTGRGPPCALVSAPCESSQSNNLKRYNSTDW